MNKLQKLMIPIAILLALVLIFTAWVFGNKRTIQVFDQQMTVLVANNPIEIKQGLSGKRQEKLGADGMLFVFAKQEVRYFWMKNMRFDLDVVWLQNGKVVKIDKNIPHPQKGEAPRTMNSNPIKVDMVLELPAGSVDRYGIVVGHTIPDLVRD